MQTFAQIIMAVCAVWIACAFTNHNQILKGLMADINARLAGIETRLAEASTEILALIETLRGEQLSDAGRTALDAIEAKANALADIVPDAPPTP